MLATAAFQISTPAVDDDGFEKLLALLVAPKEDMILKNRKRDAQVGVDIKQAEATDTVQTSIPAACGSTKLEKLTVARFKTRLCQSWEDTGKCDYEMKSGKTCTFAHGRKELRSSTYVTSNNFGAEELSFFSSLSIEMQKGNAWSGMIQKSEEIEAEWTYVSRSSCSKIANVASAHFASKTNLANNVKKTLSVSASQGNSMPHGKEETAVAFWKHLLTTSSKSKWKVLRDRDKFSKEFAEWKSLEKNSGRMHCGSTSEILFALSRKKILSCNSDTVFLHTQVVTPHHSTFHLSGAAKDSHTDYEISGGAMDKDTVASSLDTLVPATDMSGTDIPHAKESAQTDTDTYSHTQIRGTMSTWTQDEVVRFFKRCTFTVDGVISGSVDGHTLCMLLEDEVVCVCVCACARVCVRVFLCVCFCL